ncbi:MAG: tail fiber domain-containing protein, partial [Lachnospiraceae bacterium]|nr:tail fiber domain-containing protein [Lachnospiraceae bacterium]
GVVQASDFQDLNGRSMMASTGYKFNPDYLELRGLTITDGYRTTFKVTAGGVVSINGNVTMSAGSSIDWGQVSETNLSKCQAYALAQNASSLANGAYNRADSAYTRAQEAYGAADDAYDLAWENRNTDYNIFNVLTNGGTRFGIFSDSTSNRLYINANYIRAGTIDADIITLGSSYGGFQCARGHDGVRYTYGSMMFGSGSPYFIVTNAGCRMTTDSADFFVAGGVHSSEEIIIGSDRRIKNSIEYDLEKYEKFFLALRPTRFKYNSGRSGRYHTGFIAQDVEEALKKSGISTQEFAGFVGAEILDPDRDGFTGTRYNLRYGEFISLNTYMIQRLFDKVASLEKTISDLKKEKSTHE